MLRGFYNICVRTCNWVDLDCIPFILYLRLLHGMPRTIVCDCDPAFTSAFWTELFRLNGNNFNFSSAYRPQTDGQSEVVNRTIEMYLHCFTSDKPKHWVRWICWAEFCYNTSWHSAIQKTPFEVVYGREPPSLQTYVPGTAKVRQVNHNHKKYISNRGMGVNEICGQHKFTVGDGVTV